MGMLFILFALVLSKWQIYDPLHATALGKKTVWVSGILICLALTLGPYGILLLVFGNKPNQWLKIDTENISWKYAMCLIAFAMVVLVVYIYVKQEVALQGYH
jgi:hypothetical protein